MLPQTPNSAPTHIKSFVTQTGVTTHQAPCERTTLIRPAAPPSRRCHHDLEGVSPPGKILSWQSHTRRLNHTNNDPQLRANNKSSLERR